MAEAIRHPNVGQLARTVRARELSYADTPATRRSGAYLSLQQLEDCLKGMAP
jgi:hypothetical protein